MPGDEPRTQLMRGPSGGAQGVLTAACKCGAGVTQAVLSLRMSRGGVVCFGRAQWRGDDSCGRLMAGDEPWVASQ